MENTLKGLGKNDLGLAIFNYSCFLLFFFFHHCCLLYTIIISCAVLFFETIYCFSVIIKRETSKKK